jgi:hypothetical protein
VKTLLLAAVLAIGCAPASRAVSPYDANCTAGQLANLEKNYVAEVILACSDYKSFAEVETECAAYPEIAQRYDRLRDQWIDCGGFS